MEEHEKEKEMKKTALIALVSVAAIGAQAGVIVNHGTTAPSANVLTGADVVGGTVRQAVKNIAAVNEVAMGQVFSLGAINPTEKYQLSDLYLKSYTTENLSSMSGNLEVKIFSGISGDALTTIAYDLATSASVAKDDWIKLDLGGYELAAGGQYSFMVFMTSDDADNNWEFYKSKGSVYGGAGDHALFASTADITTPWSSTDPWTVIQHRDDSHDQAFFVAGSVVIPEPATLGLVAMVGGALFGIRRFFIV